MILTAKSFLDEHPRPRAEPRPRCARRSSGTLCRCTGYQKIVDAVIAAARR